MHVEVRMADPIGVSLRCLVNRVLGIGFGS
jgi:hypothetical protein